MNEPGPLSRGELLRRPRRIRRGAESLVVAALVVQACGGESRSSKPNSGAGGEAGVDEPRGGSSSGGASGSSSGSSGSGNAGALGGTGNVAAFGGTASSAGSSSGVAGGGGAAGEGGSGEIACPTDLPGPALSLVRTPSGVPYCVDTTEVTQAQYEVFRTAGVSTENQPHVLCDTQRNSSFDPWVDPFDPDRPAVCPEGNYDPALVPNWPVTCVDFCDAVSYCAWSGKRLCGVLERAGETFGSWRDDGSDFNALKNDPEHDQWYNACSGGGEREFPYGNDGPERCPMSMEPQPDCVVLGSEPPIFAVLGGVWEYQDFCSDEMTCYVTGEGSAAGNASCLREVTGLSTGSQMGFRCCYEFDE